MAALDFPNSPTLNQQYSATNGVLYTWDGAVWVLGGPYAGQPAGGDLSGSYPNPQIAPAVIDTPEMVASLQNRIPVAPTKPAQGGYVYTADPSVNPYWSNTGWTLATATALAPNDSTKQVSVPGPTAGGTDWGQVLLGSITARGRLHMETGARLDVMANAKLAAAWASDDSAKPSWLLGLDASVAGDALTVYRAPPTSGAPAWANLLKLDNSGFLNVPGISGTTDGTVILGAGVQKTRVESRYTDMGACFTLNRRFLDNAQDDTSKPSWGVQLSASDSFLIQRAPAGSTSPANFVTLDNAGNFNISNYVIPRSRGCWIQTTNSQVIAASGSNVQITWGTVMVDTAGWASGSQIVVNDASCLVFIAAQILHGSSNTSIIINQWNGSTWTSRGQVSSPVASQIAAGTQICGVFDTRYGTQFYIGITNNNAATITIVQPSYVGAFYIGKTP